MNAAFKSKLLKFSGVNVIFVILKGIVLPGCEGMSLYDLGEMYLRGIVKGAFGTRASAISFSLFLAIFPFLLFLLNLIPFIPVEGFQDEFLAFINTLLPPKTSDFFDGVINDIVNKQRVGLLSSTFVLSMLFMTNGINAVFSGFRNSFHTNISRGFIAQYSVALGVAIIVSLFLFATVYVILYYAYIINTYDKYIFGNTLYWINFGRILFFIIMIFLTMATLFYFGTKEGRTTRFFSAGALFTTILIIITTYLVGLFNLRRLAFNS